MYLHKAVGPQESTHGPSGKSKVTRPPSRLGLPGEVPPRAARPPLSPLRGRGLRGRGQPRGLLRETPREGLFQALLTPPPFAGRAHRASVCGVVRARLHLHAGLSLRVHVPRPHLPPIRTQPASQVPPSSSMDVLILMTPAKTFFPNDITLTGTGVGTPVHLFGRTPLFSPPHRAFKWLQRARVTRLVTKGYFRRPCPPLA